MENSQGIDTVLNDLAKVTDVNQFLGGIQENPQVVFDAVKSLAQQREGLYTALSELQVARHELIENNKKLSSTVFDLEAAQKRINILEKKVSSSSPQDFSLQDIFTRLADTLTKYQHTPQARSGNIHESSIFNGDKAKYATWKEGILLKLNTNSDHYPTEQAKMALVYSMLSDGCQTHIHSWINNGFLLFPSLNAMFQLLDVLFDDPNRVRDAVVRLHSNKQKNKPFSTWISEIRRDAAIAGYDKHLKPLRDIIFLNLSLELKHALIHDREIENLNLDEAISRLQDIENKQRSYSEAASKVKPRNIASQRQTPIFRQNLTTTQGGDAMDLSANQLRPQGPISPEEKERRRINGLCYYCGRGKHKASECKIKNSYSSAQGFAVDTVVNNDSGKEEAL